MTRSKESADDPEKEMLPDERAVIAERAAKFSELDDDEFATVNELAAKIGVERDE